MKNIYNDKDMPEKDTNLSGQDAQAESITPDQNAGQPQFQQPIQYQQPVQFQQPVYYTAPGMPVYPQGIPMPPVQLTPEQLNMILQQYGIAPQYVQPQPQPYAPPAEQNAADPGTRVLYQSADFDKPASEPKENLDEEFDLPEKKEGNNKTYIDEPIEIEEETVTISSRTSIPKKSTLKIEEMEMSTFELDSMLTKNGRGPVKQYPKRDFSVNNDVPFNFGQSFKVEETVDEEVSDISSDSVKEKKKLPVSEIIRRVVLGVALVAIVISAGMLINEYRLSKENDKLEEGISDLIISEAETSTTKKNNGNKTTTKENQDNVTTTVPLTPEQQWAQIQAEHPDIIFPVGIQLKYAKLYATNQDFAGYLEAKGVNLSLPIVHRPNDTDDEYYLERNFYGRPTKYGCPFVTHVNNIVELDQNTIIFGHHMNNGTVFGALDAYKSIEGFKAAPIITFNTLYRDYSWKVIAAFVTNAYKEEDNGYLFRYYFASLSSEDRFAAYLNELSQRSIYDTGVDVLPTDKLLTLSTCSHEFNEARFVVVARLVRPGESTDVDVSQASVNPSPRYPQAYYDKKKLTNPYVNASRWEVG